MPPDSRRAQRRLGDAGLELAVGVSTVVASRAQIPDAYREAGLVRTAEGGRAGVAALASMSAFEYLTLRPDATASRLIAPAIHEFVAQDSRDGGQLIATLREYVACDLNGKRAAENLHIHVNTAHYRLARICRADRVRPAPRRGPGRDPDRGAARGRRRSARSS